MPMMRTRLRRHRDHLRAPAVAAIDVRGGGPGTAKTRCSTSPARSSGSTRSRCPAAPPSDSMPAAACRPGSPNRAAACDPRGGDPDRAGRDLFDLLNGGDKGWGRFPPYRDLGYAAAAAAGDDFALGTAGAGLGAPRRTEGRPGLGIGGHGRRRHGRRARGRQRGRQRHRRRGPWFWAAPFERNASTAGAACRPRSRRTCWRCESRAARRERRENTTIGRRRNRCHADQTQAKRLAMIAQTGFARAIYPVHAPTDGDSCSPPHLARSRSIRSSGLPSSAWSRPTWWRARSHAASTRHGAPFPAHCRRGRIGSVETKRLSTGVTLTDKVPTAVPYSVIRFFRYATARADGDFRQWTPLCLRGRSARGHRRVQECALKGHVLNREIRDRYVYRDITHEYAG